MFSVKNVPSNSYLAYLDFLELDIPNEILTVTDTIPSTSQVNIREVDLMMPFPIGDAMIPYSRAQVSHTFHD